MYVSFCVVCVLCIYALFSRIDCSPIGYTKMFHSAKTLNANFTEETFYVFMISQRIQRPLFFSQLKHDGGPLQWEQP